MVLTHITGQHNLALTAIKREPKLPLDHNTIVKRHSSVNR